MPRREDTFLDSEQRSQISSGAPLSNGAQGHVLKVDAGSELLPAIKAVLQGEKVVSSGIKQKKRDYDAFTGRDSANQGRDRAA